MKKICQFIINLILVLILSTSAFAASAFETLEVVNSTAITAALLTNATYGPAIYAIIGPVETDQVRFRLDGTAPTALVGHLLQVGQTLTLDKYKEIANFHAIKVTNTAAVPVTIIYGPKN